MVGMNDWISVSGVDKGIVRYEYPPIQVAANHHRQHKGLITTNAVKAKDGWLGQVLVDQNIVWETEYEIERETALELADERVALVLGRLFDDADS